MLHKENHEVSILTCAHCGTEFASREFCPVCGRIVAESASLDITCQKHPERVAYAVCVVCQQHLCEECCFEVDKSSRCEEHQDVRVIEGWAEVYASSLGEVEAELIRENLQAEGIDARLYSQSEHMFALNIGSISVVRVLVPAWSYEEAQQLLANHQPIEGDVLFACPNCGEAYDSTQEICAQCGAPLPEGISHEAKEDPLLARPLSSEFLPPASP